MSDVEITETELSVDANAILACARKWGTPFTRQEIVPIAPGAAWKRYAIAQTVGTPDPISELITARMIEVVDRRTTLLRASRVGVKIEGTYKVYALTGRLAVPSLAELLDRYARLHFLGNETGEAGDVRAEILDRFGRAW